MISSHACARLAAVSPLLAGIVSQPLAAQGLGASAGVGVYRSNSTWTYSQNPGIGAELRGQWSFPSGFVLGLGARGISFHDGGRATAFLDGRYAPAPSVTRRIRSIFGVRAGPFLDDSASDLLTGVDVGTVLGFSLRVGTGVSLTLVGDLGISLASGDYNLATRRFLPGLMMGLTFH